MEWTRNLAGTARPACRCTQKTFGTSITSLHRGVMDAGALSARQKQLLALAIAIAQNCPDCTRTQARCAAEAGATREHVAETVGVATLMVGEPAYRCGVWALEAFDSLSSAQS